MKMIGFGIPSWNLMYFPMFPICETLKIEFITLIMKAVGERLSSLWYTFMPLLASLIVGLPYICILILDEIKKRQIAKQTIAIATTSEKFMVVTIQPDKYEKLTSLVSLICISLIQTAVKFILAYSSSTYGYLDIPEVDANHRQSSLAYGMIPVTFVTINVINYFILKLPFYRHQTYSLIIIAIGMILQISPLMRYEKYLEIKMPLFCVVYILNAIQFVLEKWLMNKKYFTVFGLLFYQGVIGVMACVIIGYLIEGISSQAAKDFGGSAILWGELELIFTKSTNTVLYIVGMTILNCVSSFSIMKIKYHYTPMHCGISNFLCGLGVWIVLLAQGLTVPLHAEIIVFGHLFGLVGILIYTEIIIIYLCGLNTYTMNEISKRSREEFSQAINDTVVFEELRILK